MEENQIAEALKHQEQSLRFAVFDIVFKAYSSQKTIEGIVEVSQKALNFIQGNVGIVTEGPILESK